MTDEERFWSKVDKTPADGCWVWTAGRWRNGYGRFSVTEGGNRRSREMGAHRWSYQRFVGPAPDGMEVCHQCDNRRCVRPDHLFLGTHLDNVKDCAAKGRHVHGDRRRDAKLSDDKVRLILSEFAGNRGDQARISRKFALSPQQVSRICRRERWKHVEIQRATA